MQLPHNKSGGSDNERPHGVMAGNELQSGASAAPSADEPDFSEFMWMANEDLEDFDRKVISEIDEQFGLDAVTTTIGEEEEEFLQKMLEEEEERDTVYFLPQTRRIEPPAVMRRHDMTMVRRVDPSVLDLSGRMHGMNVTGERIAAQSILNPLAAEFVPGQGFQEVAVAAAAAALHAPAVAPPAESPLYCSTVQGAGLTSIASCLHSQNLIINSNSSQQHLIQQEQQQQQHQQHQQQQHQHQRFINPVRAQLNGHNPVATVPDGAAVRRFFPGVNVPQTVYVSNMPGVYPLMNGSQFIQAPAPTHSHLQQQQQPHQQHSQYPNADAVGERSNNEDEGFFYRREHRR